MVQVVTPQIRSAAQKAQTQIAGQQKQLVRQREQLSRQQQRLTSAIGVRTISREQRQLQTRQLGSTSQQIQRQSTQLQKTSRELERIRRLPTAKELFATARLEFQSDLSIAKKAVSKKEPGLLSTKRQREFFRKIKEAQSDAAIIAFAQKQLQQTLTPSTRQTILDLSKGITPTEIALKMSLPAEFRQLSLAQIPKQLEIQLQQSLPPEFKDIKFTPKESGQIRSFITKTKEDVRINEKKFSTFLKGKGLTDTNIEKFISKLIPTAPKREEEFPPFARKIGLPKLERKVGVPSKKFFRGFLKGNIIGARDEPVKAVKNLAIFIAIPPALRGAAAFGKLTKITPALAKFTPEVIKKLSKFILTKGLLGAYTVSTGLTVLAEDDAESRGQVLGRITSTEIVPFIVGTRTGVKGDLKLQIKQEFKKELNKLPADKKAAFEDYIKQSELLGKFNPTVKNIKFDQVESIPAKAIPTLRKFFKDNNIAIGGSTAQTSQLKLTRKAGDIDAYVPTGKDPRQSARDLVNILKKSGIERVSISPRNPSVVTIAGKKAVDFNNLERLLTNIAEVTPFFIPTKNYLIKTPEGIVVQRIGVQLKRKAVAGFLDPKRIATGKFRKDLKDFKSIADQMFKTAELNARRSFIFKEKRIKELEKQFGVKISRAVPEKFIKPEVLIKKPSKVLKPKKVGVGVKGPPLKKIDISRPPKFKESSFIKADKIKASQKPFTPSQAIRRIPSPKFKPSQLFKKPPKKFPLIIPSQPFKKLPKKPPIIPTPFKPTKEFFPSQLLIQPLKPPKLLFKVPPPFTPTKIIKKPFVPPKPFKKLFIPPKKIRRLVPKPKRQPGYFALVKPLRIKVKGKKPPQKRLTKINEKPATKQRAKDALFYILDQSLATTGRIVKSKKPAKRLRGFPRGYAQATRNKFREFKIRKGKKIFTPNRFIEIKGRPRLDTLRERKRITALSLIAQKRRQGLKKLKPIKLKSTFGKKKK